MLDQAAHKLPIPGSPIWCPGRNPGRVVPLPLYVKDPATGDLRGNLDGAILIEVAQALAARLGVQLQLIGYPTPPEAMNAVKASACDLGFFGIDPTRAAEADFSPPLVRQEYSYLVRAGSSIRSIADRTGPVSVLRWCAIMPRPQR